MKITHSKYFYYFIIAISFGTIVFSVYYQLGGFKELKVNAFEGVDYAMAGVDFKGSYKDPEIEHLYSLAKDQVSTGKIKGILGLVDYVDQDLAENEVHYFVGIILLDKITELPQGFKVKKMTARGVLGVTLDTHPIVRPPKIEIEGKIYATAQQHGLEVEDYFLEKHYADDRVVVEGFVK